MALGLPPPLLRQIVNDIGRTRRHRRQRQFGRVQIISCAGRFLEVIEDAVRLSTLVVREDSPLKIVPIPHLIALKLYAGGHKSKADIIELLVRNPDLELDEVRSVCARYRLGGLEELITESRSV